MTQIFMISADKILNNHIRQRYLRSIPDLAKSSQTTE